MKRIAVPILAVVALAACGGDDTGSGSTTSDGGNSDDAVAEAVTVEHAWARATAPGQPSGAIYFDLTVRDDDTLLAAAVPSSVAAGAEIHEVVEVGASEDASGMSGEMDDMDSMDDMTAAEGSDEMDMDMSGAMRMQELPNGLALTGGETVSFEPGSYHVMIPDLAEPLEVGDEFAMTLDFANADDITVTVTVAETAP